MIPLKSLNQKRPIMAKSASINKHSEITKHFSCKSLGEIKPKVSCNAKKLGKK